MIKPALEWSPQQDGRLILRALFEGSELGRLALLPRGAGAAEIRTVEVAETERGAGIGRMLMLEAEAEARRRGWLKLSLPSRDTAVGFYEKLGWKPRGERYVAHGIEHQDMEKELS